MAASPVAFDRNRVKVGMSKPYGSEQAGTDRISPPCGFFACRKKFCEKVQFFRFNIVRLMGKNCRPIMQM